MRCLITYIILNMTKTEVDTFDLLLNESYRPQNQYLLIEEKTDGGGKGNHNIAQRIKIIYFRIDQFSLYKFDDDAQKLFPFFKQNVKSLLSLCDYVLFAYMQKKCYIILFELKRGKSRDAEKQIDATKIFIDYLINTADRLSRINEEEFKFDKRAIIFRKVIVKRSYSIKEKILPIIGNNKEDYQHIVIKDTLRLNRYL